MTGIPILPREFPDLKQPVAGLPDEKCVSVDPGTETAKWKYIR
jgi:hypothetical protein